MKKVLLFLLPALLLMLPGSTFANPFLMSSPSSQMTDANSAPKYVIQWAVGDIKEYDPHTDGALKVDLAPLPDGVYNIEVWAKSVWGVSTRVKFNFIKATPSEPGVYIMYE